MPRYIFAFGIVTIILVTAGLLYTTYSRTKNSSNNTIITNTKENKTMGDLMLTSSTFEDGDNIPSKYTCDGEDINPPLTISDIPEKAQSLVLIMDDPDAIKPAGKIWDHWVIFDIPVTTKEISENTEPEGVRGNNSWPKLGYGGPCPPDGEHRYFFKLYALDTTLGLAEGSTKQEVENAMIDHILAETQLMGRYTRQ